MEMEQEMEQEMEMEGGRGGGSIFLGCPRDGVAIKIFCHASSEDTKMRKATLVSFGDTVL